MHLTSRTLLYLILDCFLLAASLLNVPNVIHRPGAPFEVLDKDGEAVVGVIRQASACASVQTGDVLLVWDGTPAPLSEIIEYLADRSPVGTDVPIVLRRGRR